MSKKKMAIIALGFLAVSMAGFYLAATHTSPEAYSLNESEPVTVESHFDYYGAGGNGGLMYVGSGLGSGGYIHVPNNGPKEHALIVRQCGLPGEFKPGEGGGFTSSPADKNGCIERSVPVNDANYNIIVDGQVINVSQLKE